MIQIRKTDAYAAWIDGLRDLMGRARILARIERLAAGNPGDVKPVGEGVSELRIDCGPGYRVYFIQRGKVVIVLLAGGDKSTQDKDIRNAKALAKDLVWTPTSLWFTRHFTLECTNSIGSSTVMILRGRVRLQ